MAANNPPTRPLGWLADFIIDNNASQMCPQSIGKALSRLFILRLQDTGVRSTSPEYVRDTKHKKGRLGTFRSKSQKGNLFGNLPCKNKLQNFW